MDSEAARSRRKRAHASGDHSLCRAAAGCIRPRPADGLPAVAGSGPVLAAVRAELVDAGALGSPLGALALLVAERLDGSSGVAGVAPAARELRAVLAAVTPPSSPVGWLSCVRLGVGRPDVTPPADPAVVMPAGSWVELRALAERLAGSTPNAEGAEFLRRVVEGVDELLDDDGGDT